MSWGKPHEKKETDIKGKLEALKAKAQKAFDSHSRFWLYTALELAYALYDEWKAVRRSKANANKAAALFGLKVKEGAHPLAAIIMIVTPTGNERRISGGAPHIWYRSVD
jgi:hypothetical protein